MAGRERLLPRNSFKKKMLSTKEQKRRNDHLSFSFDCGINSSFQMSEGIVINIVYISAPLQRHIETCLIHTCICSYLGKQYIFEQLSLYTDEQIHYE